MFQNCEEGALLGRHIIDGCNANELYTGPKDLGSPRILLVRARRISRATLNKSIFAQLLWSSIVGLLIPLTVVEYPLEAGGISASQIKDLKIGHSKLKADVQTVQGTISVYRKEEALREALSTNPSEVGVPLVCEAKVWRDAQSFRADWTTKQVVDGETVVHVQSYAFDNAWAYELSAPSKLEIGLLRMCEKGTPEYAELITSIRMKFVYPIDSLWSYAGTPVVDLLQRPDMQPDNLEEGTDPDKIGFVTSNASGIARFQLHADGYHPFAGYVTREVSGTIECDVHYQVAHKTHNGLVLPSRVVEVVSLSDNAGYTQVVDLQLDVLENNSPLSKPLSSEAFRDLGVSYQVNRFAKGKREEIVDRHEMSTLAADAGQGMNRVRGIALWINGVIIACVIALLVFMRLKANKTK